MSKRPQRIDDMPSMLALAAPRYCPGHPEGEQAPLARGERVCAAHAWGRDYYAHGHLFEHEE